MRRKRILSLLIVFVCVFCMSIPAFAYSGYGTPSTSGISPYQTPSKNYTLPGSGTGNGSGSTLPGYTPGSGANVTSGGGVSGGYSGSGGYMPGSGVSGGSGGSGVSGGYMPGSGVSGGYGSSGGSTGNHFGASFSGGNITINLPLASGTTTTSATSAFGVLFQKYKTIGVGIIRICAITAILCLLVQITKLGAAGDNERMRATAIKGIIYSGAVIAAFGSLALVVGMFWNAFV